MLEAVLEGARRAGGGMGEAVGEAVGEAMVRDTGREAVVVVAGEVGRVRRGAPWPLARIRS